MSAYQPPTIYNDNSKEHRNVVFADTLEAIENIVLFSISNYFLRFSNEYKKIESYELPSDDDMLMQAVDQMICEVSMFNEHCYMGMCIANEEWREGLRKTLFNAVKGNKK